MLNWFKLTVFVKMHKRVSRMGEGYSAYTAALKARQEQHCCHRANSDSNGKHSYVEISHTGSLPQAFQPPAGLDSS